MSARIEYSAREKRLIAETVAAIHTRFPNIPFIEAQIMEVIMRVQKEGTLNSNQAEYLLACIMHIILEDME